MIGIIALLLGILLPSLAKARREGKKVACKAQLHDLGAAVQMYLNHADGRYPKACYSPTFNPNGLELVSESLRPYVTKFDAELDPATGLPIPPRVFACPADEIYAPQYGLSYSYYQELGERRLTDTFFWKVLAHGKGSPSLVPVLWDAENFHGGSVPFNWLMADGHVEQFLKDVPTTGQLPIGPPTPEPVPPPPGLPNP